MAFAKATHQAGGDPKGAQSECGHQTRAKRVRKTCCQDLARDTPAQERAQPNVYSNRDQRRNVYDASRSAQEQHVRKNSMLMKAENYIPQSRPTLRSMAVLTCLPLRIGILTHVCARAAPAPSVGGYAI